MRRGPELSIILLTLIFFLSGCAGFLAGYGNIRPDRNATMAFESFQMNPDYIYYYSGSDVYPNALVGLDKKYRIEPELWKRMTHSPLVFKELVSQMHARALQIGQTQHGFSILDDQGRQIGVWYSILRAATSVKMKGDNTVLIYQPPLDTYKEDGDQKELPMLPRMLRHQ
jgi:hypothetical protein